MSDTRWRLCVCCNKLRVLKVPRSFLSNLIRAMRHLYSLDLRVLVLSFPVESRDVRLKKRTVFFGKVSTVAHVTMDMQSVCTY